MLDDLSYMGGSLGGSYESTSRKDTLKTIYDLNLSKEVMDILENGLYTCLLDLAEVSPKGVPGLSNDDINNIHSSLSLCDDMYKPHWGKIRKKNS
nr:hypothetical protein [Candidatus Gracilibacteria bacterium]